MSINITIKTLKIWRSQTPLPPPFPKKLLSCGQFCDRFDGVPYKVFQLYTDHLVEVIYNTESRAWEIDIYHQFTQIHIEDGTQTQSGVERVIVVNRIRKSRPYPQILHLQISLLKGFPILKYSRVIAKSVLLHDKVEKCTNTHFHFNDRRAIYNICK